MREAAIAAGLVQSAHAGDRDWRDRLRIITEPEAAAVHCAHLTDLHKLSPSQNFMVCDAGGGTVDLAVYKVRSLRSHLVPKAEEDAIDSGEHGGPRDCGDCCTVWRQLWKSFLGLAIPRACENSEYVARTGERSSRCHSCSQTTQHISMPPRSQTSVRALLLPNLNGLININVQCIPSARPTSSTTEAFEMKVRTHLTALFALTRLFC